MAIVRNITDEPKESPLLEKLRAMNKARFERVLAAAKTKKKNKIPTQNKSTVL